MAERISLLWQILQLSFRLVCLRWRFRRLKAANRRLKRRLMRLVGGDTFALDRPAESAKPGRRKRGSPLIKTGLGGDFVLQYYPAFGSEAQARRGDLN